MKSYGWDVVQNSHSSACLTLYSEEGNKKLIPYQGWVTGEAAKKLFDAAGVPFDASMAATKKKGFKSFPLKLKTSIASTNEIEFGESANVVGMIPGVTLKDEYIIYSAHWDHLGIGQAVAGDSIYNGAYDNATGIAALALMGRRFASLPEQPKRSILFLALTAEESNLLGSQYYVENPLVSLEKTAVCLNLDCYADYMRTGDVVLSAAGQSETDNYVIEAAATQGGTVVINNDNSTGWYYRSDHYNFAKMGVPIVIAKGGNKYLDPEAAQAYYEKYHKGISNYPQPSDEYHEWWNLSGTLEDIYLFYGIGLRLANDGYFPKWYDGVEFKKLRVKK
ncbi:MAG: M28 family peptidase [Prevotellaceae bacterium]|nr:M28 family peptidase [Prevotellaceae bacterium]